MTTDYQLVATKAIETLINHNICASPVDPLPILKRIPGVLVMTFEAVSKIVEMERKCVISTMGEHNQAAFTSVNIVDGKTQYLVMFNQKLPSYVIQRALARELAHIVLGHDGSKPEEVRDEESKCFAINLLFPRPLIHAMQTAGVKLTVEVLANLTGCNDYCLSCMRNMPAIEVPANLNRKVRDQMAEYISNFINFQRIASLKDSSMLADLGSFMDGYIE